VRKQVLLCFCHVGRPGGWGTNVSDWRSSLVNAQVQRVCYSNRVLFVN
jgi:hypothetical protein